MAHGLKPGHTHIVEQRQPHKVALDTSAGITPKTTFSDDKIIEAVKFLQNFKDSKLLRKAAEKALEGLWILFPLGQQVDDVISPIADTLIQCLHSVSETLTEEEVHQLNVFQAIHTGNRIRIRSLARFHSASASDSSHHSALSLICLLRSSDSLVPSEKWSIYDFINTAKLTLKYITRLSDLVHTLDLSEPLTRNILAAYPIRDKVLSTEALDALGFQIYSTSPLYNYLLESDKSCQGSSIFNQILNITSLATSGCNARKLALNALSSILRSEISKFHEAASSEFQAIYPCLELALFGVCKRPNCHKQHVSSFQASEDERQVSFNLRTRALIMQLLIVDPYYTYTQTKADEAERREIRRIWTHKIYENFMPLFPPIGGLHCIDGSLIPELDKGTQTVSVWCQQALFELDPCHGMKERFLSEALVSLDLGFRADAKGFSTYVDALHSSRLVKPQQDLIMSRTRSQRDRSSYSIMHDFINFYRRKSDYVIRRVIQATHHVTMNGLTIEVNVLVHLLEFIGREIIVQHRTSNRGKYGVFDGLVVPQSWALDIAKRPPLVVQTGFGLPELMEYLNSLYKTLENLREYSLKPSCLYSFSGKAVLNLVGRGVLILRICRLIVLVANNTSFTHPMKEDARLSIKRALTGSGDVHRFLCDRVIHNNSWSELELIIMRCPLNRGTDRLVHLFLRKGYGHAQPRSSSLIQVVAYSAFPELNRLLAFTGSVQRLQPTLNNQAQPFYHPSQSSGSYNSAPESGKHLEPKQQDAKPICSDRVLTCVDPHPLWEGYAGHALTPHEIESGQKILFAYRQHVRQRRQSAAQTIWRYYSRYLHHRNNSFVQDDCYLKFQREYGKDIKMHEKPGLPSRPFDRYRTILIRCMPHVVLYLRGLEHVNQEQKQANRERLHSDDHCEDIRTIMDTCSTYTRKLRRLMLAIMPGSGQLKDLSWLQARVKEITNIYGEMEQTFGTNVIPASLEQHYHRGVAVILAQRC